MMITELISHHPPSRNNTPVSRDEARQVKQKPLIATRVTLGWPLPPFPSSTKLARGGPLKTVIFYFQDNSYHRVEELIMAQSVWNFFFFIWPSPLSAFPQNVGWNAWVDAACKPFAASLGWRPFVQALAAPIIKHKFANLLLRGQAPPPSLNFSSWWMNFYY